MPDLEYMGIQLVFMQLVSVGEEKKGIKLENVSKINSKRTRGDGVITGSCGLVQFRVKVLPFVVYGVV